MDELSGKLKSAGGDGGGFEPAGQDGEIGIRAVLGGLCAEGEGLVESTFGAGEFGCQEIEHFGLVVGLLGLG